MKTPLVKEIFLWNYAAKGIQGMSNAKSKPTGQVKTDARKERLEKALRENLKKRKAQTKSRNK